MWPSWEKVQACCCLNAFHVSNRTLFFKSQKRSAARVPWIIIMVQVLCISMFRAETIPCIRNCKNLWTLLGKFEGEDCRFTERVIDPEKELSIQDVWRWKLSSSDQTTLCSSTYRSLNRETIASETLQHAPVPRVTSLGFAISGSLERSMTSAPLPSERSPHDSIRESL